MPDTQHIALYRKYRPDGFASLLGQDHVSSVIANALKEGKVAHAYLFSGPRGTGKTSTARIVAKMLNVHADDLFEIDGASNRGIEEIRALREAVQLLPSHGTRKMYIIDEVHMFTKEAFNALLKTLEEPPAHVLFVLATTETHKLPDTIISRCQHFSFKKPSEEVLQKLVVSVAKQEGFSMKKDAASLIALLGDGSFRDTHVVLEKVLRASKDKEVTREIVESVTGMPPAILERRFVEAIALRDIATGLGVLKELEERGADMEAFVRMVLRTIRTVLLYVYAKEMQPEIESRLSADEREFLLRMAPQVGKSLRSDTLLELLSVIRSIPTAPTPVLPLEIALIRLSGVEGQTAPKK